MILGGTYMINFSSLPFSEAELVSEVAVSIEGVRFTFHENQDERKIYNDLNKRLGVLETSLEMDNEELASIHQATDSFKVAIDDKEEVLLRIDWLRRLYEVKEVIQSVDTKEYAERLRTMIASVQTCPMKNELMDELNSLIASIPSEQVGQEQMSLEQELMEKAIEEAGDVFINLGKAGREFVIEGVIKQSVKKATVEDVKENTIALEQRVESLADLKGQEELIHQLESLPIASFSPLSNERKARIAEKLLEMKNWNGLATLERVILQMDRFLTNEEQKQQEAKNTIVTSNGNAALTLDIKHVEDGRIQIG